MWEVVLLSLKVTKKDYKSLNVPLNFDVLGMYVGFFFKRRLRGSVRYRGQEKVNSMSESRGV